MAGTIKIHFNLVNEPELLLKILKPGRIFEFNHIKYVRVIIVNKEEDDCMHACM